MDSAAVPEPHNAEAERALLGSLLIDRDAIADISERVRPDAFFLPAHQTLYKGLLGLWKKSMPCDILTITNLLTEKGKLDQIGGVSFLAELMQAVPTAAHAPYYAEIVASHARRRAAIAEGARLVKVGYDTREEEPDWDRELVAARRRIALHEPGMGAVASIDAQVDRLGSQVLDFWETGVARVKRVKTGLLDLDKKIVGMQGGDLGLLLARTSIGKTALMLTSALTNRSLIFTLEMREDQIVNRLISQVARVPYDIIARAVVDQAQKEAWADAAARVRSLPITVIGAEPAKNGRAADLSIDRMELLAAKAVAEQGVELVYVDHLGHVYAPELVRLGEYERTSELVSRVKRMAQRLDVPVILLGQLNRSVESRSDRKPEMADARGSGRIEEIADWLATLYRRQHYVDQDVIKPDTEQDYWTASELQKAILDLHKNRNGPTGEILMGFDAKCMRFVNMQQRWMA